MSLLEAIETFENGLMWIGLGALLLMATACVLVGMRRVGKALCVRLRPAAIGVFAVAAVVATSEAQKRSGAMGTSRPTAALVGRVVLNAPISPTEIAQGWRLESVVTNDVISYTMPTNGVEYRPWFLRGGYETHFPLDLEFGFPFGTGVVRRVDVLSGGMVESYPRPSAMSICAAREWASIVPGVGRFWWAAGTRDACPYQVKLLTWENVYAGRDCTGQYNAQIELRGDGNFVTRSNNVERVYRRVLPYDWDNDGLPNAIDPAPVTPIVPSAWNQSEEWAATAFPSNAAEIAAVGGYVAWAAARAEEPDRRLVTLGVAFDDGSAWPAQLEFGGVPVVADGKAELAFAIDCGAKVPFTLTSGRLASVEVRRREDTSPDQPDMVGRAVLSAPLAFPHERTVNDVTVHLDGPRFGWLCRTAEVSVDPSWLPHFFPDDSAELTATVSDCHSNAYLGCTWTGGAGITFSHPHSLTTDVTYNPDEPDNWATNGIDLITQFVGYSLTNHVHLTVGTTSEPPLRFSLGCQSVFFLNDADFLDGACPSNRPERIRPVTLGLTGPLGTNGTVRLSVQGNVDPVLFQVEGGVTNRVTSETVFPLAVTNDVSYTENYTVYMSCPKLGTGTITATFTPAAGGDPQTASVTFRCIEPLRRLANSKRDVTFPLIMNPSRLVYGTNAVLCVDVNGPFQENEIHWQVKEGPATISPTVGKRVVVTPTAPDGVVTVEARFNDDEIQPQFVLPIVQERVLDVKAFVVCNEKGHKRTLAMSDSDIRTRVQAANLAFGQVGIRFNLLGTEVLPNSSEYWNIVVHEWTGVWPLRRTVVSSQVRSLVQAHNVSGCINIYFVGDIRKGAGDDGSPYGFRLPGCVFVKSEGPELTLAHEFGHMLGLWDCYDMYKFPDDEDPLEVSDADLPISASRFQSRPRDWGGESGRGFYASTDTYRSILLQFLMFGEGSEYHYNFDIPDGAVECINNNNRSEPSIGAGEIGATSIKTTNEGVYAQ